MRNVFTNPEDFTGAVEGDSIFINRTPERAIAIGTFIKEQLPTFSDLESLDI
jgi:hypothetical protein